MVNENDSDENPTSDTVVTEPPKPKPPVVHQKTKNVVINIAHFSMQFDDTKEQQNRDAGNVFDRGYRWVTGTEAGHRGTLLDVLRVRSATAGYTFHVYKSNWIAVKKSVIVKGSYDKGGDTIVDNDLTVGKGSDSNISWIQYKDVELGRLVTVLSSHYPVKGRPDASPEYSVNLRHNKTLAQAIGEKAEMEGAGKALVFYGGDQNIVDRVADTFFGAPLTSAWDELGKHEDTGHGNIDVIASYDGDGQVKAKYVRALDDKELFMFADHFPVEAGYSVRVPI